MLMPSTSVEIDRIYSRLHSEKIRTVTITSANAGEGVSSVALSLAQRSLLADRSTLIVDLNLYRPAFHSALPLTVDSTNSVLHEPELVSFAETPIVLTGITAPTHRETILQLRQQQVLNNQIQHWLEEYDLIIFDTSPINRVNANNIPAERVAAACDACLFVVMAEVTTQSMLVEAVEKLKNEQVNIVGCVFNDKYNPSLKDELLRELNRLPPWNNRYINKLKKFIQQSSFLSQEV